MLEVRELSVSYGQHRALEAVSLQVKPGEIVVILGANGAGKSTLLRTLGGIGEGTHSGAVEMDGHPVLGLPVHRVVERGIALVPEGRGVFSELSVQENLLLGAYLPRARDEQQANLERVYGLFPKLHERRRQAVRTMSGGEQQMVAIGRAMMSAPSILMLDEPSLGLSPLLCKELFHSLLQVRGAGLGVLLVEQNAKQSLAIADRGYLLENARIVHADSAARLLDDPAVQQAYLGGGGERPSAAAQRAAAVPAEPSPAEIAQAALATLPFISPSQVGRQATVARRSDELIGTSIDQLVQRASRTESGTEPPARPVLGAASASTGNDRLSAVLAEIEQAAVNARLGPRSRDRDSET